MREQSSVLLDVGAEEKLDKKSVPAVDGEEGWTEGEEPWDDGERHSTPRVRAPPPFWRIFATVFCFVTSLMSLYGAITYKKRAARDDIALLFGGLALFFFVMGAWIWKKRYPRVRPN